MEASFAPIFKGLCPSFHPTYPNQTPRELIISQKNSALLETGAKESKAGEPKPLGGGVGQDGAQVCVFAAGGREVPFNYFPAILREGGKAGEIC